MSKVKQEFKKLKLRKETIAKTSSETVVDETTKVSRQGPPIIKKP